ncbi:MAG: hypothetical protein WCK58_03375, partial [Chloroflexota bacterium]
MDQGTQPRRAARRLRPMLAAVAALGLVLVSAGGVVAHTPTVSLTCQDGLKVSLTAYNAGQGAANTVSVSIDDVPVAGSPFAFAGSYTRQWAVAPATVAHTAKVVVFAWDDPTGSHGWSKTFNLSIIACEQPTPTPTPTPTPSHTATSSASASSSVSTLAPTVAPTPSQAVTLFRPQATA